MKVSLFIILCCISLVLSTEHPPTSTCLGELATSALRGRPTGNSNYCTPDSFIEIEFKLRVGCNLPTYSDQGVRLEVRTIYERWQPIRYYALSSIIGNDVINTITHSLVHLNEDGTASAQAANYTSNLPVHLLNSSDTVTVREYLCGSYIELLRDDPDARIRIRWMQRFRAESMADKATWALDDVKIKLWNGSYFVRLLDENFDNHSSVTNNREYVLNAVTVREPQCGEIRPGAGKALYFSNNTDNRAIVTSRRSIVINLLYHPEEICEVTDPFTTSASGGIMCSSQPLSLRSVTLQCSQGGRVNCSCSEDSFVEGVICEEPSPSTTVPSPSTAEPSPSTTEFSPFPTPSPSTTEPSPSTAEPSPSTLEPSPSTTEPSPSTAEPSPSTFEPSPSTTEPSPSTAEPSPSMFEPSPSTTEPSPSTAEPSPSTFEPSPSTTEFSPIPTPSPSTTEHPPSTTEPSPSTTDPLSSTTEPILSTIDELIKNISKLLERGDFEGVLDSLNTYGKVVPKRVSKVIVTGSLNYLLEKQRGNSSASGPVLAFLDRVALRYFNTSQGKCTTDSYTLDVVEEDTCNVKKSLLTIDEDEGAISLPGELFEILGQLSSQCNFHIVSYQFKNLTSALPVTTADGRNDSIIVSPVVSTALRCGDDECPTRSICLEESVKIRIHHFEAETNGMLMCSFLDLENNVWSSEGCRRNQSASNSTYSLCECQHLTHFAILLSPTSELNPSDQGLIYISYIGCSISIVFLLLSIAAFIKFIGKELFTTINFFIHLNLCIALLLAYVVFLAGMTTATGNRIGCAFVAALLHYLFTAVFCWMLCEGIMLYLMLVVVFSSISKKWWLFLLIGWGPPVIIVGISVAIIHDQYGTPEYCWISTKDPKKGAIWAFAVPMLVIVLINTFFLVAALRAFYKTNKRKVKRNKTPHSSVVLFKQIFKGSIILLPLLGLTWVFGLFAVSRSTTFFAYIFTILNSLQGLFIFILHVLRNRKILVKLPCWRKVQSSTFWSRSDRKSMSSRISGRSSTVRSNISMSIEDDLDKEKEKEEEEDPETHL